MSTTILLIVLDSFIRNEPRIPTAAHIGLLRLVVAILVLSTRLQVALPLERNTDL
jgi:hypothetical protein